MLLWHIIVQSSFITKFHYRMISLNADLITLTYISHLIASEFLYPHPTHTGGVGVGYYVFMSAVRVSVHTSFPFDNLSIYKRISFKFCVCICTNNVSLGFVNGQLSIIYHRVMALVNVQKMFLASSSFTIWSIMMKLHKND